MRKLLIIILVFSISLYFTKFATSQTNSFCDNFNDGNYNGWTILSGQWEITDGNNDEGAIKSTGGGENRIRANVSLGYGIYEYDLKMDWGGIDDGNIFIQYKDENNYLEIALHCPGDTRDYIAQIYNGKSVVIAEADEGLTENT